VTYGMLKPEAIILAHPPQAATLGWGRGLEDTYGQNVTISPSVVTELPFLCRSRTSLHAYQVDVRGE